MVIDVQERLFNAMEYDIRRNVVRNIGILLETANAFSIPVVLTEQYSKGLGRTIPDIREHLAGIEAFDKTCFNCMLDEPIRERIAEIGRRTVILCGIETHICVLTTALSLLGGGVSRNRGFGRGLLAQKTRVEDGHCRPAGRGRGDISDRNDSFHVYRAVRYRTI